MLICTLQTPILMTGVLKLFIVYIIARMCYSICTICNKCLEICPVEAISIDHQSELKTDINLCILCFACIKNCPSHARGIDNILWSQAMELLQKKCLERKEPEIYLKGLQ